MANSLTTIPTTSLDTVPSPCVLGYIFISFIVLFRSRIYVFLFYDFYLFVNFSFFMCIVFLISLNYFSVFSCSSLSSLKPAILNSLSGQLQISVFGIHDQKIMVFFLWYQVSLIFHVPESLALLSWYLKQQSPPPAFIDQLWERNAFYQPARHSEVFPDLQWICLLHTCTFCDRILKLVTLQHTRPGADRLPSAFLWSVLKLMFVVSPSPAELGWLSAHAQ